MSHSDPLISIPKYSTITTVAQLPQVQVNRVCLGASQSTTSPPRFVGKGCEFSDALPSRWEQWSPCPFPRNFKQDVCRLPRCVCMGSPSSLCPGHCLIWLWYCLNDVELLRTLSSAFILDSHCKHNEELEEWWRRAEGRTWWPNSGCPEAISGGQNQ